MADENEDAGTRYYGTTIDDPLNYGFGYGDKNLTMRDTSVRPGDRFYYAGEAPIDSGEVVRTPDFSGGESQDHDFTKEEAEQLWKAGVWDQVKGLGKQALDLLKTNGAYDPKKLAMLGAGLLAASKPNNAPPTGYQGKIPKLTATSNMLTAPPVGRRPGSGGINYGGGVTYRDEKGNLVSSNEKTLEELRQAAINNPFNRGATYEGQQGLGQSDLVTLLNQINSTTTTTPVTGGGSSSTGGGSSSTGGGSQATDPTGRYGSIWTFLQTKPSPEALAAAQKQYGVSNTELAAAKKWGEERYNSINTFLRTNPSPEALAAAQKQYGVSNEELASVKKYGQERSNSINQFLATNPSPEALAAAQKQYGVSDAELAAVRGGSNSGATTGSRSAALAPLVGSASVPGQYGAIARPGYQQTQYTGAMNGTPLPDGRILTAQGIYNPKTGDVLTPDGYRVNAFGGAVTANQDAVSKEDAELMKGLTFSMDPNREATPEEVRNYIQWQMTQPNPYGQGTLADVYAKQGITDPYNSPIVQQQAQEQLKRQDRRDAMYAATQKGLDPSAAHSPQGYGMWEDPNWLNKQAASAAAAAQRGQQQAAQNAAYGVTVGGGIAGTAPSPKPAAPAPQAAVAPPDVNDWAKTQQGQAAGGINSVYDSINKFLATNPNQEALSSAMQDFGVNEKTLEAAKSYAATPAAPAPAASAPAAPEPTYTAPNPLDPYDSYYATGYAKGGLARDGFVFPADVVSHYGNGSSEAGLKLLASKIGATPIKGDGDGMSDSIKTNIDGVQEARVANDEAYVSPEMVKKLGNGSPEKGARKLYAMMDKIRKARTGSTEQGKEIDPDKFMPGGSVQRYAPGGTTTVPTGATGSESSLSNWAGDYVTNMLGQGAALANKPYEAYTGPLTAGSSQLQNQAFNMAGNLRTPGSIAQAAGTAGGIADLAANLRYTPQTTSFLGDRNMSGIDMAPSYSMRFSEQPRNPNSRFDQTLINQRPVSAGPGVMPPGGPDSGFPMQYRPEPAPPVSAGPGVMPPGGPDSGFPMQYRPEPAPPVSAGPGVMPPPDVTQEIGQQQPQQSGGIAQQYMNPYLESALRPQMAEMQRAADIARMSDAARLTQAGAFGGSRQAIMESEGRRNLLGKQSDALAQGYSTAYDKAMAQFNADQARRAQEAQFGASFGLQGLQTGLQGAQTQAQAGALQSQADLSNLRGTLEAGGIQRGIESEGIAADKAQFEEARLNPYKMVQFQQSLLSGLPLSAQSYSMPGTSNLQQFAGGATTVQQLLDILSGKTAATTKT